MRRLYQMRSTDFVEAQQVLIELIAEIPGGGVEILGVNYRPAKDRYGRPYIRVRTPKGIKKVFHGDYLSPAGLTQDGPVFYVIDQGFFEGVFTPAGWRENAEI